ncbi:hypothetical protein [Phyllobacterium sp. K27]
MEQTTLRALSDVEIDSVAGGLLGLPGLPGIPGLPGGTDGGVSFAEAFATFIQGGAHLGQGAAELVAGAYTGIATTPGLVLGSLLG